jgi:hypothetical protein
MTNLNRERPRSEAQFHDSDGEWIMVPFILLALLILLGIGWTLATGYGLV